MAGRAITSAVLYRLILSNSIDSETQTVKIVTYLKNIHF